MYNLQKERTTEMEEIDERRQKAVVFTLGKGQSLYRWFESCSVAGALNMVLHQGRNVCVAVMRGRSISKVMWHFGAAVLVLICDLCGLAKHVILALMLQQLKNDIPVKSIT